MKNKIVRWIQKTVRNASIKETKRLCALGDLVKLSMSRMKYNPVLCPLCRVNNEVSIMVFRRSNIVCEPNVPIRDDVALKCVTCNHTLHVGNPLTRQQAEHEIYLRGSPYLLVPTYSLLERKDPDIKKRLEALGYGYFE